MYTYHYSYIYRLHLALSQLQFYHHNLVIGQSLLCIVCTWFDLIASSSKYSTDYTIHIEDNP